MGVGSSVGVNLLSALIWLIIGAIALQLFKFFLARKGTAFSKLSGITRASSAIHLVYGLVDSRGNGTHYSVDEGDVCALCLGLSFLETKYDPKKVFAINSQAARTNLGGYTDIVSISGPIWNDISAHYLSTLDLPAVFSERTLEDESAIDTLVVKNGSQETILETSYTDGVPRECYGIVVAGPVSTGRSDQKKQNIVVAAGISALGTYGAVCWLKSLSDSSTSKLPKNFRDASKVKVAILAIRDNSPKGFRAYAADNSNPGFLSFEVIHELEGKITASAK